MELTPAMRAMLRLAFAVFVLALLAGVWELAARQAPGSWLYLAMLPGPISSLRETATVVGLVLLGATWLVPAASSAGREPRALVRGMVVGAVLGLCACVYAAALGMHGVQFGALPPAALPVFLFKHAGLGLLSACLFELGRRAVFGKSPHDPRDPHQR